MTDFDVAMMHAEMSIWSDRRLLGMPAVRWSLVRQAARVATGQPVKSLDSLLKGMSSVNADVARSAYGSALAEAQAALGKISIAI